MALAALTIGLGGLWWWASPGDPRALRLTLLDGRQVALVADMGKIPGCDVIAGVIRCNMPVLSQVEGPCYCTLPVALSGNFVDSILMSLTVNDIK